MVKLIERIIAMQKSTHDLIFKRLATDNLWSYFAVDEDGSGYVFEYEPGIFKDRWYSDRGDDDYIGKFDPQDWQKSLIIRRLDEFNESWFNRDDCPEWANYAIIQHRGKVALSDIEPFWFNKNSQYYQQDGAKVQIMEHWGVFQRNFICYSRPTKTK